VDSVFTESQVQHFHEQDLSAARAVVVLMCAIFAIGIFIYSIVLGIVASQG
jgi:hypothetical protein